jgi:hypothetical protein
MEGEFKGRYVSVSEDFEEADHGLKTGDCSRIIAVLELGKSDDETNDDDSFFFPQRRESVTSNTGFSCQNHIQTSSCFSASPGIYCDVMVIALRWLSSREDVLRFIAAFACNLIGTWRTRGMNWGKG